MNDELYHYGVLGMRWGIRRYQNKDGTLTPAGRKRYAYKGLESVRYEKASLLNKHAAEEARSILTSNSDLTPKNRRKQERALTRFEQDAEKYDRLSKNIKEGDIREKTPSEKAKSIVYTSALLGGIPGAILGSSYASAKYGYESLDFKKQKEIRDFINKFDKASIEGSYDDFLKKNKPLKL